MFFGRLSFVVLGFCGAFADTVADLLLPGVFAECAGDFRVYDKVASLQDARRLCAEASCDFYNWNHENLSVCSLTPAGSPKFTEGSTMATNVVGVRGDLFTAPAFETMVNYQAVCESAEVLQKQRGVYSFQQAAKICESERTCTRFTMSTVSGLKGASSRDLNTLWLCSGTPKFAYSAGWLSAVRAGMMQAQPQWASHLVQR